MSQSLKHVSKIYLKKESLTTLNSLLYYFNQLPETNKTSRCQIGIVSLDNLSDKSTSVPIQHRSQVNFQGALIEEQGEALRNLKGPRERYLTQT